MIADVNGNILKNEDILKLDSNLQAHKNYQNYENSKFSDRMNELEDSIKALLRTITIHGEMMVLLEQRIKDLEKCHHMGSVNTELSGK